MSTCFAAYPESGKITVVDDFALATSYKVIYNVSQSSLFEVIAAAPAL